MYYSLRTGFGVLAGAAIIDAVVTSDGVSSVAFGFDGISGIGGAAVYGDGVVPLLHISIIHVYVNNAIRHLYSKLKLFITLSGVMYVAC